MGKKNADIEELRTYRELKASGRLFIIPEGMKDGDTIWHLDISTFRISSHMIIEWVIVTGRLFGKIANDDDYILFSPEDIGTWIFTSPEEAEEAVQLYKEIEIIADEPEEKEEELSEDVSDDR